MLVDKDNLGFGFRSWRYAMVVNDGTVEVLLREAGLTDNAEDDTYEFTTPESVMNYLKSGDAQEATQ